MIDMIGLLQGVATACSPMGIGVVILGVVLGILIGATPGMSPAMGVALLVPLTYGMEPAWAFLLFIAAYQAANYGGSITAIAVNAPGTPSSAVSAIDGYALTQQGKAKEALTSALSASTFGGLFGAVILALLAVPIAQLALQFGPAEYFALALFGLTSVVAFGKSNKLKSLGGVVLGLLLYSVRADPFTGDARFTFGSFELYDGIAFIPALIGLFALGEVLLQVERGISGNCAQPSLDGSGATRGISTLWNFRRTTLRASLVGTCIGIIPGAGATIASFISYGQAKRSSAQPERFGEGHHEGIVASEAANSSSVGGALIPLLSLGIPGSATDAVLLGALTLHGLVAGPELFSNSPDVVYGIFVGLFIANLAIFVFGTLGNRLWLSVIRIPPQLLLPLIMWLCVLGSYTSRNSLFDAGVCVATGVLGWLLKRQGVQPACVVLGLVLGGMVEENLRRVMLTGDPLSLFLRPLALLFLVLTAASLLAPFARWLLIAQSHTTAAA